MCILFQDTWDSIVPADTMVSWLPSYHDMGLVGFIIVPAFTGAHCVSMSPISFIKDAAVWMDTASRYRATHVCAPNFGFALAARKTKDHVRDTLNLSALRQAICAAEPIRSSALDAFAAKFGPVGFRRDTFNCGYGLAEVVLTCCGHDPFVPQEPTVLQLDKHALETAQHAVDVVGKDKPKTAMNPGGIEVVEIIGCGYATPSQEVTVVDTERRTELPDNHVGEVWVSSAAVSVGYWGLPDLTEETFNNSLVGGNPAQKWLRTGDLAFMRGRQLFVTGRIKDLIIIHGRNVMPQDLDMAADVAGDAWLRPGCSAAFSVERGGEERIVIVSEVRDGATSPEVVTAAARSVRLALLKEHQLGAEVVLIRPRTIPKTTSGKIQRSKARAFYEGAELKRMPTVGDVGGGVESTGAGSAAAAPSPAVLTDHGTDATNSGAAAVELWLHDKLVKHLQSTASEGGSDGSSSPGDNDVAVVVVDMDASWAEIGLDSVSAVNLSAELGDFVGHPVPPAAFFTFESPRALATAPGLLTGSLDIDGSAGASAVSTSAPVLGEGEDIPETWHCIEQFGEYVELRAQIDAMESGGLAVPYLRELKADTTEVNFNTYNYLGLAKRDEVKDASVAAVKSLGTSMSSSPIVGQTSINVELERKLAEFMGAEAAVVFIGGWQANVTTIDVLVGPGDLVLCYTLNHNCCVTGQRLSGATVMPFPHNDFRQVRQRRNFDPPFVGL